MTTRLLPLLLALLLPPMAASCTVQLNRRPPAKLEVVADPPDASVYVDERFFGRARVLAERPKALPEGPHRLTVEAPGHFPHDLTVKLVPGVTTVRIELRPIPP
ncbi:MAG: PEGA domain-containing protein [Myxococcota bacterium]